MTRWTPFDHTRNFPDLGPRFAEGERRAKKMLAAVASSTSFATAKKIKKPAKDKQDVKEGVEPWDLTWGATLKRTFEAYVRREAPNMYGEWLEWAT